jgi:general secretion pathway protein M
MADQESVRVRILDHRFWQARTPRERGILVAGGALLLFLLIWLLLVDPALDGRARWQKDLPALRADYAQMQALAQQARAAPPPATTSTPPDRASIERSLNDAGLKPQSLNVSDALVSARFNDVSFSALTDWLHRAQRESRLVVSDASMSARERIDRVDARVSLKRLP